MQYANRWNSACEWSDFLVYWYPLELIHASRRLLRNVQSVIDLGDYLSESACDLESPARGQRGVVTIITMVGRRSPVTGVPGGLPTGFGLGVDAASTF